MARMERSRFEEFVRGVLMAHADAAGDIAAEDRAEIVDTIGAGFEEAQADGDDDEA